MKMRSKTLVFMYIGDSYGFHNEKLNFSTKVKFDVDIRDEGQLFLSNDLCEERLPKNFWGTDILEINLLVGENGSGKTTIMRLLCQWVCQLSERKLPAETGILTFEEDGDFKYIAFSNGVELSVTSQIPKMEFGENGSFSDFFQDIRLIYCSNTMTEVKINDYNIFEDYSLPFRIREANRHGHALGEDITGNYECYEFNRQINVALNDKEFPIDYILLEIQEYPSDIFESLLLNHQGDLRKELMEIVEEGKACDRYKESSRVNFLKEKFLYCFFTDILVKLLKWGEKYGDAQKNFVEDALYDLAGGLFRIYHLKQTVPDKIKHFLNELLQVCRSSCDKSSYKDAYEIYWGKSYNYVEKVITFIADENNLDFLNGWISEEIIEKVNEKKYVWKMNLKEHTASFRHFWEIYHQADSYVENIRFSWDASSGQKNWAQLFSVLKSSEVKSNREQNRGEYIWYLIDEPDNTFHPEWERKLVDEIVKTLNDGCGKKQVWLSTHSPIMLSDMPGQAVTCLKNVPGGKKEVVQAKKNTFGQNIYVLYDDAFFLQNGVIGEFASKKIIEAVVGLEEIERNLMEKGVEKRNIQKEYEKISEKIKEYEKVANLVEGPMFGNQIRQFVKSCKNLMERVGKID